MDLADLHPNLDMTPGDLTPRARAHARPRLQTAPAPSSALTPALQDLATRLQRQGDYRQILYVPGPGDVQGTYRYWREGRDDPSIPSLAYSQQVYELADRLGAQLTVLTEGAVAADQGPGPVRFRQLRPRLRRGLRYHLGQVGYALQIVRHALATRADAIILQRNLCHFWPLALLRMAGIPVFVSLHNTLWPVGRVPGRKDRLLGRLNGWFFRHTARVVGVSGAVAAQVRQVAGEGFDRADVQMPQYRSGLAGRFRRRAEGRPLGEILYLGRIEKDKGVFLLLDAFARLAREHPSLRLRFVGDGSALSRLRMAADILPMARRIEIAGPCGGDQVFAELARTDLLVCPTTGGFAEGLAKTPVEAVLAGVPSLVTDVVPAADVLGDAVEVIPADDLDALEAAIAGLARDPARLSAMSRAAETRREMFFDRGQSLGARLLKGMAEAAEVAAPAAPLRTGAVARTRAIG